MCRSVPVPMTLRDLEKWDAKGHIFQAYLLSNARTVWSGTNKFGRITHVGNGCISRGSATPPLQGAGPRPPQFWRFSSIYAYIFWHRTTKFVVVAHSEGLVFRGSATPHLSARRCHIPTLTVSATILASSLNIQTPLLHCRSVCGLMTKTHKPAILE